MKILKHKNLMGLIFSALLAMPFLGIVARCGYVIANKNAYQSYGGTTENQVQNEVITSSSDLNTDDTYYLTNVYANNNTGNLGSAQQTIIVSNFEVLENNSQYDISNTIKIGFYQNPGGTNVGYYFWYNDTQNYNISSGTHFLVKFNYLSNNLPSNNVLNNTNTLYKQVFNNYNSLDNVFEYSVSTFTSENNLGNVNLFSWFTDIFLSDNVHNNLYVGFANWYMNYAMLIACMHLLFLVLMWFVNFARRLLERGMNYDF